MKKLLTVLAISLSSGLTGCYALQPREANYPDMTPLVDGFIECFGLGLREQCEKYISFPFYVDGKGYSQTEFYEQLPEDGSKEIPEHSIKYRVFPIQDLEVFWPRYWDRMQEQAEYKKEQQNLFLMPVSFVSPERDTELGWLILRRTAQGWRVSGIVEN